MKSTFIAKSVPIAKWLLPERLYIDAKTAFSRFVWRLDGSVAPPSGIKIRWVRHFQRLYGIKTFVETGTCRGDMINAVRDNFSEIYSVELDERLHETAKSRFSAFPNIHLFCGSSDQVLSQLLPAIRERCLFWLDAHYSGGDTAKGHLECPILGELAAVEQHPIKDHVILVDDAAEFDGTHDYPTLKELENFLKRNSGRYRVEVKDNIIFCFVGK